MFPKLKESKQFKNDLKTFTLALNNCPEEYKGRMQELYNEWVKNSDQIDAGHDLYSGASIDPKSLTDARFSLNHTRAQIFNLIKKLSLNY